MATCDLSEMRSVRRFAGEFGERSARLDVLVNNAGVLTPERSLSADGIELTLAINVLGPFLLTKLLVPVLESSAPSRVINVSSGGMYTQGLHLDDLQRRGGRFRGAVAYSRSKRIEVVLTELWSRRLQRAGVVVNSMHPGWVDTAGLRESLPGFRKLMRPLLRTAQQGADTIVWLGACRARRRGQRRLLAGPCPAPDPTSCPGAASPTTTASGCGTQVERLAGV